MRFTLTTIIEISKCLHLRLVANKPDPNANSFPKLNWHLTMCPMRFFNTPTYCDRSPLQTENFILVMQRLLLISIVLPFLFCSSANAQQNSPSGGGIQLLGKLIDDNGSPVPYSTLTLLTKDSSAVGGALSKDNGSFSIENIKSGSYLLRISGIGYQEQFMESLNLLPEDKIKNLGNITLKPEATMLKGAVVSGEKPMIEMRPDKKIFNVGQNLTSAGGSAADVLQNVPAVQVDADGNVALRGKSNVTILIDGKPATLLGGDAASALQGLPASSIESIEVITNPSAKYDAQGMTGIVNIVTKKDKRSGFNGSASLGAGTRDKYNGSVNLNYRSGKWTTYLNSSFRINQNYQRDLQTRTIPGSDSSYNSFEKNQRSFNGWFTTIGADYAINKKNSISITENINLMKWGRDGGSVYTSYSSAGNPYLQQQRNSHNIGYPITSSTSLDYKHKFNQEKEELTANATFAHTIVEREQTYTTTLFDGDDNLISGPILQDAGGNGGNSSLNAQADYTRPLLTKTDKLDAGVKTQLYWFSSKNDPTITLPGGTPQTDISLLNRYDYNQQTHAAYVSYSDVRKKWSYSAGLRGEYAVYEGKSVQAGNSSYTNTFLNLFPSAFLSYQLSERQSLYTSYTRRTDRPSFWQLMPYIDISNPQDTSTGNPALKPEFIDNVEVAYSRQFEKGHTLLLSAYYQHTQNVIERYRKFYDNGYTFTQPQNLLDASTLGLELTARVQITKAWDATLSANYFYNKINGSNIDPALNNSGPGWFTKLNTNLKLPAGFSFQLNGNYESAKISGQGRREELYWLDAAIKKSLLQGRANIVLNVSDIFNTKKYTTVYNYPTYYQTQYRDRETRVANITFTYRFGKNAAEQRSRRKGNDRPATKDRNNLKSDDGGDGGGF